MKAAKNNMLVEHRIPVVYRMRGYAIVRVPITATEDDITDALESIDPSDPEDIEDAELHDVSIHNEDFWSPDIPDLTLLQSIGAAFVRLTEEHNIAIVTHQCCSTDSSYLAGEMMEADPSYQGYAYIHTQNVQDIDEGGSAFIGYGARQDSNEECLRVARIIADVLKQEEGLSVEWNNNIDEKIEVKLDE